MTFFTDGLSGFADLMQRGGAVMWPLLGLSLVAVTLAFERCWFFARANSPGRRARMARMAQLLRAGAHPQARALAAADRGPYAQLVLRLLSEPVSEAAAAEAVEDQRHRLERFMPTLSTIITAAPLLGILGTVLGIIASFEVLGDQASVRDPGLVSQGIAEALLTTAAGLVIALGTLFPYNALRAQVDRTLSRLESLAAAALPSSAGAARQQSEAVGTTDEREKELKPQMNTDEHR